MDSFRVRLAFILILLAGSQSGTLGSSQLNFPRLSYEPGTFTGVAIANPNSVKASVELRAWDHAGRPVKGPGITNPRVVEIGPSSQYARTTYEIFGSGLDESTVGWFSASSPTDGLTGFFLFLDAGITFFDGADLPQSARSLVFNEIRLTGGYGTELNLVNPGSIAAYLELILFGGTTPIRKNLQIPPLGAVRLDAQDFFAVGTEPLQAPFVTVTSTVEVFGFEFVKGPGDLLGLNAKPGHERLNTLYFPQFAVLPPYQSDLVLLNASPQAVILSISAHRGDGELFLNPDVRNNPVARTLAPGQSLREDVAELFGFSGTDLLSGWLKVESTSPVVTGSLTYALPELGSLASVSAEPVGRRSALFSHIATTFGYFTGLAVLNPGSLAANVRIQALQPDGDSIGVVTTVLRPGERISKLLTELIPATINRSGGMIWVSSDIPVYMTGLFVNTSSGVLSNVPPQPVPESFRPDSGVPRLKVTPGVAVVAPGGGLQFQAQGVSGPISWKLEGGSSGTPGLGAISPAGFYRAAASAPGTLPVSVIATAGDQSAGATIDVIGKETVVAGLGVVRSVAYLQGLARLFTAELSGSGAAVAGSKGDLQPTASGSAIFDVTQGSPIRLADLPGDEVSKMVPFQGIDGREYLLLSGLTSGSVFRLDPLSQAIVKVAEGLRAPAAMAFDPVSGHLFVAESDRISLISRSRLEAGLTPAPDARDTSDSMGQGLYAVGGSGIAVDACSGDLFISSGGEGLVKRLRRETGEVSIAVEGLQNPGQLLLLHRSGLGCPDSPRIFVVERGADRVTQVSAGEPEALPWLPVPAPVDLAFRKTERGEELLIAQTPPAGGRIDRAKVAGIYQEPAINPPTWLDVQTGPCRIRQITNALDSVSWLPEVSGDGSRLVFVSDHNLTGENPDRKIHVYLHDLASGEFTLISRGLEISPQFLPYPELDHQGDRIVFEALRETGEGRRLLLYEVQTGVLTEIVSVPDSQLLDGSISDSGDLIAFSARVNPTQENADLNQEVFVYSVSTGGYRQITRTTALTNHRPQISGDGSRVVFVRLEGSNLNGYSIDVASGQERFLATLDPASPWTLYQLKVSRDGGIIVFTSELDLTGENPTGVNQVFTYQVASGETRQITRSPDAGSSLYTISADGTRILIASQADFTGQNPDGSRELFSYAIGTGQFTQLSDLTAGSLAYPTISEDGSVIGFFSADNLTGENIERNAEVFVGHCDFTAGFSAITRLERSSSPRTAPTRPENR